MGLIDLIFPKNCLECKKSGDYICKDCLSRVRVPESICPKCNKASIDGFTHVKCRNSYGVDRLVSIWNYEGVIRKAIIVLKYKYATEVVNELESYMVTKLQRGEVLLPNTYCLVPIPMYWYRENTRGFNQSYELGKFIAKAMGWKFVPDLLVRKKLNTPQAQLSGKDRKENIKGAFSLNANYYPRNRSSFAYSLVSTGRPTQAWLGYSIILFDDVYTTGSTIKEAAMILKRKGFENVWGLTVAR